MDGCVLVLGKDAVVRDKNDVGLRERTTLDWGRERRGIGFGGMVAVHLPNVALWWYNCLSLFQFGLLSACNWRYHLLSSFSSCTDQTLVCTEFPSQQQFSAIHLALSAHYDRSTPLSTTTSASRAVWHWNELCRVSARCVGGDLE